MTCFAESLRSFNGTDEYHTLSPMHNFVITDGVRWFAENGAKGNGAFWVLDIIGSYQIYPKVRAEHFQAWTLGVSNGKFTMFATDGNNKVIAKQSHEFTDLEEGVYTFFLTDKVLMLESEY